jgi:hypothetical protein
MGKMKETLENNLNYIDYIDFMINFQEQLMYARDLGTSE